MSAPIGSAFAPLPSALYTQYYKLHPSTETVLEEENPIKAYRIRNTQTGLYWSNGRWRKTGKVWVRKCDVTNALNCMRSYCREQAIVVEYNLVPQNYVAANEEQAPTSAVAESFKEAMDSITERFVEAYRKLRNVD